MIRKLKSLPKIKLENEILTVLCETDADAWSILNIIRNNFACLGDELNIKYADSVKGFPIEITYTLGLDNPKSKIDVIQYLNSCKVFSYRLYK